MLYCLRYRFTARGYLEFPHYFFSKFNSFKTERLKKIIKKRPEISWSDLSYCCKPVTNTVAPTKRTSRALPLFDVVKSGCT